MSSPNWTLYANRATALAARFPSSSEVLTKFAQLAKDNQFEVPVHDPKTTPPWPNYCPCCGSPPGASALRPEADGSRRSLICAHCTYEWPYQRILCPNCQEQRFEELPVYVAQEFPHLRVECCATCKHYLIASDLVKEPEAIPLVEDIAALSLHLWATGQGYTKKEPNLFGF